LCTKSAYAIDSERRANKMTDYKVEKLYKAHRVERIITARSMLMNAIVPSPNRDVMTKLYAYICVNKEINFLKC